MERGKGRDPGTGCARSRGPIDKIIQDKMHAAAFRFGKMALMQCSGQQEELAVRAGVEHRRDRVHTTTINDYIHNHKANMVCRYLH